MSSMNTAVSRVFACVCCSTDGTWRERQVNRIVVYLDPARTSEVRRGHVFIRVAYDVYSVVSGRTMFRLCSERSEMYVYDVRPRGQRSSACKGLSKDLLGTSQAGV